MVHTTLHHPSPPLFFLPLSPELMESSPLSIYWLKHVHPDHPLFVPSPPPPLANHSTRAPPLHLLCPKSIREIPTLPCLAHFTPCSLLSRRAHTHHPENAHEAPAPVVPCASQESSRKTRSPTASSRVPRNISPPLSIFLVHEAHQPYI